MGDIIIIGSCLLCIGGENGTVITTNDHSRVKYFAAQLYNDSFNTHLLELCH